MYCVHLQLKEKQKRWHFLLQVLQTVILSEGWPSVSRSQFWRSHTARLKVTFGLWIRVPFLISLPNTVLSFWRVSSTHFGSSHPSRISATALLSQELFWELLQRPSVHWFTSGAVGARPNILENNFLRERQFWFSDDCIQS